MHVPQTLSVASEGGENRPRYQCVYIRSLEPSQDYRILFEYRGDLLEPAFKTHRPDPAILSSMTTTLKYVILYVEDVATTRAFSAETFGLPAGVIRQTSCQLGQKPVRQLRAWDKPVPTRTALRRISATTISSWRCESPSWHLAGNAPMAQTPPAVGNDGRASIAGRPLLSGIVVAHQRFKNVLRWNPHFHAIVLESGFDEGSTFFYIPFSELQSMTEVFRRRESLAEDIAPPPGAVLDHAVADLGEVAAVGWTLRPAFTIFSYYEQRSRICVRKRPPVAHDESRRRT